MSQFHTIMYGRLLQWNNISSISERFYRARRRPRRYHFILTLLYFILTNSDLILKEMDMVVNQFMVKHLKMNFIQDYVIHVEDSLEWLIQEKMTMDHNFFYFSCNTRTPKSKYTFWKSNW